MTNRQRRPRRLARLAAVPLTLAWMLTGLGPAGAAPVATGSTAPCVSVTGAPAPYPGNASSVPFETNAVAIASACNAWMVGGLEGVTFNANPNGTLIEHWDGSSWSVVPSPSPEQSVLFGVAATSASDAWAVGLDQDQPSGSPLPLIEHWDGTSWTQANAPDPGSYSDFEGVAATSATNAWAVGSAGPDHGDQQPLMEHWNGSDWSIVASPSPSSSGLNYLVGVAASSATEAWAFGTSESGQEFFEHWNGSTWSLMPSASPASGSLTLRSVTVTSATDAWAAGYTVDGQGRRTPFFEHWNGSAWSVVSAPAVSGGSVESVAADSPTDAWAAGAFSMSSGSPGTAILAHWDGSSWTPVPTPIPGDAMAVAVAPNRTGWVVGNTVDLSTESTSGNFALHLQCC